MTAGTVSVKRKLHGKCGKQTVRLPEADGTKTNAVKKLENYMVSVKCHEHTQAKEAAKILVKK